MLHYRCVCVCGLSSLQINSFQKAKQENSIPHQSTQQNSVQHQPTVQYAMPNKKAAKNQDKGVSVFKPAIC